MNPDTQIKLELSVGEVNVILRSLGKLSFEEVAGLIGKIKQQGESQLQAPSEDQDS